MSTAGNVYGNIATYVTKSPCMITLSLYYIIFQIIIFIEYLVSKSSGSNITISLRSWWENNPCPYDNPPTI